METQVRTTAGERLIGGAGTALVLVALGAMLLGLAGPPARPIMEEPTLVAVPVRPPMPRKDRPARAHSTPARQAPSPANLRAKPIEIVAPPPRLPLVVPPPVTVAAVPPGAADRRGPGEGAGGTGTGPGGGGNGTGDGGEETPPYRRKGALDYGDLPAELRRAHVGGTVGVEFSVEVNGRATGCTVTRSSGEPELDAITCQLIERKFRFEPSRAANGRPVRSTLVERETWVPHAERGEEAPET